ncbi:diverse immunoglobulin domain-containing protein 3.3 isoform X2 [Danio rerio]|uniref:diverse immunoglobulin domain-containing protein 3.3 isoform X2 n=1 Tax=Danio rerio TaxID=7955 RepID=UPI00359F30C9
MAKECHVCLLWLIILCPLPTGTSGAEETHVFFSSGENVRLPCNNALSDCTSTVWNYNRHSETVELVAGGSLKTDIMRRERLSLGSDCSLNIKKVKKEDYGFYICQQYVNGEQYGPAARVYLQALHVSSSLSQTGIRAGRSVTLYCQLDLYASTCGDLVNYEGYQLMWVNQAGENLMKDSRYQISDNFSSRCMITLTTKLLKEDHNREWRCQLTQRNQLKTSASFTVKYSASTTTTAALIPVATTNSVMTSSQVPRLPDDKESSSHAQTTASAPTQQEAETKFCMTFGSLIRVIVIIVEIVVFAAPTVILLQIICARRAGRKNLHPEEDRDACNIRCKSQLKG